MLPYCIYISIHNELKISQEDVQHPNNFPCNDCYMDCTFCRETVTKKSRPKYWNGLFYV